MHRLTALLLVGYFFGPENMQGGAFFGVIAGAITMAVFLGQYYLAAREEKAHE